jgi:RHS repeat-associated protein
MVTIGFNPAEALTEFLYSGEQFDSKIGQQYLRARYYDPTTGRFNRLDPFFGNMNDPQSLHKYLYTHGDPINGIDPNGLMSVMSCISVATIGIGAASIGIPVAGVAYLSVSGQVSGYKVIEKLMSLETWAEAMVSVCIGTGVSVGMQKILISAGKSIAEKITPISGLFFGILGLMESIKMTHKMLTSKLPTNEVEQYIATMLATNVISTIFLNGVRLMPKNGKVNDAVYFSLTNEEKTLYNKGQIMIDNSKYKQIIAVGLGGDDLQSIIKRGEWLTGEGKHGLNYSRIKGFWEAGVNSVQKRLGHQTDGITLGQWFGTGLTPEGRFILVENAGTIFTTISGIFGMITEWQYNSDDWTSW